MHQNLTNPMTDVPHGYCQCGCGEKALRAAKTNSARGIRAARYITNQETGCWEWQRKINKKWGYGYATIDGRTVLAHRAMYEATVGPIPAGMEIDHTCDNPRCVNPAHLEPKTPAGNTRRSKRCKLSMALATEIRVLYARGGISQAQLAARYKIAQGMISRVIQRKAWA